PPIEHIGHGPSGIACYPGVGMPSRYDDHFFLCDFPGGVLSFGVKPQGSSFEVVDLHRFLWENYATDVDFSPAGGVYVLDWVYGWDMPNKGRVFRVYDPKIVKSPQVARTRELIATDFAALPLEELSSLVEKQMLLGHPDRRVRQALQFAVASHGMAAYPMLAARAAKAGDQTEQLHLIWALGQIARRDAKAGEALPTLFDSARPDVRGQLAHVVGDARLTALYPRVLALVKDMNARVRFEAVLALSRLGNPDALSEIVALVRHAENKDPYLRHAAVMALSRLADERRLVQSGSDASAAVRLAALVALRRQKSAEVARFLDDADAGVVLEAARAINDVPIDAATPALAALLAKPPRDDRVVLRAMHAAYRVGGGAHAAGIAAQAARTDASEAVRLLAVRLLEAWGGPAPRDAVTGAYRPMPARPADAARSALAEQFDTLFKGASVAVQARAVHAAGVLKAASLSQRLGAMVTAREVDAGVRSEALTALSALGDPRLSELVESALREGHPVVARQAVTMLADSPSPDARKKLAEVALSDAPLTTRQAAILALRRVPEGEREAVTLELAERLRDSKLPPELMLETIDLAQGSKNKRVGEMLEAYHKSLADKGVVEKRRELLEGGNPIAGREVFERPAAMCQKCHAVDGRGGAVGPELAGVGALRTRRQLLESLLLPNQEIVPEYRSLIIETDEGTYVGRLMRETARDLLLLDAQNQQITINKPDITDRREGLSAMPTNVTDILSPRDIRDLVAYLASLRQPASQAH
ncbi:MAG: HEAT repeat domain-containing protein, partial [Gemmatimonadaceae bacterium]|nr:HEAT repeat domain-containing protein [Gemmatimonadaceae bacterium]